MSDNLNLYKVKLRGMFSSTGINYQESYVVADNPTEAYQKVHGFLDDENLGFPGDRELESVTLIAHSYRYIYVETLLFY